MRYVLIIQQGHKRWDQSVDHGYTKVLQLTHENLLPALDRCSAILTRIHGLIEYHKKESNFSIDSSDFALAGDVIRCMRLLGHQVLIYGGEEHRQFQQFSKWFRHEIDVQATDPSSATAEETLEKDIGIEYGNLLAFVEGPLEKSRLGSFLEKLNDEIPPSSENTQYGNVKDALTAFKEGKDSDTSLLRLTARLQDLSSHCERLIGGITKWQRESSTMTCGIFLEDEGMKIWDMRMVVEEHISTYVALVPTSNVSEVRLHRVDHTDPFEDVAAAVQGKQGIKLSFGEEEVVDLKFVDDDQIMFLLSSKGMF